MDKAAADIRQQVEKRHGSGACLSAQGPAALRENAIPTGCLGLDRALGTGGWPRGVLVEVLGEEGAGKAELALHAVASAQAAGGLVQYVDVRHELDLRLARAVGVDTCALLVSQPDSAEQALDVAEQVVRTGQVALVVVDSLDALVLRADVEGESPVDAGVRARLMSQATRKLCAAVARGGACVLFLNTGRARQAVAADYRGGGGNALKFCASLRVEVGLRWQVLHTGGGARRGVCFKVLKNKLASPFQEAESVLLPGGGMDSVGEVLDLALQLGHVEVRKGNYVVSDQVLGAHGHGRERVVEDLARQGALLTALDCAVWASLAAGPWPLPAVGNAG